MKLLLLLAGIAAWIGVIVLSIGMAAWGEPVWGFFPIAFAVIIAWAIGEALTDRYLTRGENR